MSRGRMSWEARRRAWNLLGRSWQGGQAMVEYALVTAALMGGLGLMTYQVLPDFIEALQIYLNGYYFMLNVPIP